MEETISHSVVGSLSCFATADYWYNSLAYRKQFGVFPASNNDVQATAVVFPGDHVMLLETDDIDSQPGLVDVTGNVDKIKIIEKDSPGEGKTCWLWSGSNQLGPLFE